MRLPPKAFSCTSWFQFDVISAKLKWFLNVTYLNFESVFPKNRHRHIFLRCLQFCTPSQGRISSRTFFKKNVCTKNWITVASLPCVCIPTAFFLKGFLKPAWLPFPVQSVPDGLPSTTHLSYALNGWNMPEQKCTLSSKTHCTSPRAPLATAPNLSQQDRRHQNSYLK